MLKKLKSIFIVDDGTQEQKTQNQAPVKKTTPQKKTESVGNQVGNSTAPPVAGKGKVSEKFTQILLEALEKNNIDGFDYLEFKQSLQSLKKMAMDDQTRFQSAYAMAQTMGASPKHLIDTAQHYIDVLKQEEQKFAKALVNQRAKNIDGKQQAIAKVEQTIKQKAEQIQRLSKEIETHQKDMEAMKKQISNATVKVQQTKNDFEASYSMVVNQIITDVESMKKYLK